MVVDGGDVRLGRYMDDRFDLVVDFSFVNVSMMFFPIIPCITLRPCCKSRTLNSVGDPDPQDPLFLGLPDTDPRVRGPDPNPNPNPLVRDPNPHKIVTDPQH